MTFGRWPWHWDEPDMVLPSHNINAFIGIRNFLNTNPEYLDEAPRTVSYLCWVQGYLPYPPTDAQVLDALQVLSLDDESVAS